MQKIIACAALQRVGSGAADQAVIQRAAGGGAALCGDYAAKIGQWDGEVMDAVAARVGQQDLRGGADHCHLDAGDIGDARPGFQRLRQHVRQPSVGQKFNHRQARVGACGDQKDAAGIGEHVQGGDMIEAGAAVVDHVIVHKEHAHLVDAQHAERGGKGTRDHDILRAADLGGLQRRRTAHGQPIGGTDRIDKAGGAVVLDFKKADPVFQGRSGEKKAAPSHLDAGQGGHIAEIGFGAVREAGKQRDRPGLGDGKQLEPRFVALGDHGDIGCAAFQNFHGGDANEEALIGLRAIGQAGLSGGAKGGMAQQAVMAGKHIDAVRAGHVLHHKITPGTAADLRVCGRGWGWAGAFGKGQRGQAVVGARGIQEPHIAAAFHHRQPIGDVVKPLAERGICRHRLKLHLCRPLPDRCAQDWWAGSAMAGAGAVIGFGRDGDLSEKLKGNAFD